jgi:large subunit ribosomal protein L30
MSEAVSSEVLQITLKRSGIGGTRRQKETLRGLGLTRREKTVMRNNSPSLQGMIRRVQHLIEVRAYGS